MAKVFKGRFAAKVNEDGVVLFLIGMRINQLWRVHKWIPVFIAMAKMILELRKNAYLGLLSPPKTYVSGRVIMLVQYWSSFEKLEAYARSANNMHLPAWRAFNRQIRDNGSVGIWHETYQLGSNTAETVYGNMPIFGLAGATSHVRANTVGETAARRLGIRDTDDAPVEPY